MKTNLMGLTLSSVLVMILCSACGSSESKTAAPAAVPPSNNQFGGPTPPQKGQPSSTIQGMIGIWISGCENSESRAQNLEYLRHEYQIATNATAIMKVTHYFSDSKCQYETLERRDVYNNFTSTSAPVGLPSQFPAGMAPLMPAQVVLSPKNLVSEVLIARSSPLVDELNRTKQCGATWVLDKEVSTVKTSCTTASSARSDEQIEFTLLSQYRVKALECEMTGDCDERTYHRR